MSVFYSVFGLLLQSNLAIPGLTPEPASSRSPDVTLYFGLSPGTDDEHSDRREELVYTSSYVSESGEPALRIWKTSAGGFLRLEYFDGTRFWLDPAGKAVWSRWTNNSSLQDAATYLLGPVLGLLLRLRGITCLHASAVAFEKCSVALAGSEGAGKSTTAAAFAARGHAVVSDDVVAIAEHHGSFHVLPAYPYLSLWPASLEILYGAGKTLPAFSSNFDKRQLNLADNGYTFQARSLPLGAVFLLGQRSADAAAPFLEALPAGESLLALVANSYATNLLDNKMRGREFELLGRLVATIPVWRVRAHEDGSRIGRLCDVICEKCSELGLEH